MSTAVEEKLLKIFRCLGSNQDGEILAAVNMIKQLCATEDVSFNDLAISIGSETAGLKYTESDAEIIFGRGRQVGRQERVTEDQDQEFFDVDGRPRWFEIAKYNRDNRARLKNNWMRIFSETIVDQVLGREPTRKQAVWILTIFCRLGGELSQEIRHQYF